MMTTIVQSALTILAPVSLALGCFCCRMWARWWES